jgi:hypothetical protein
VKLITHLHLVPMSKNEWSYTFIPSIRLHGVVLKTQGQLYLTEVVRFALKLLNHVRKLLGSYLGVYYPAIFVGLNFSTHLHLVPRSRMR